MKLNLGNQLQTQVYPTIKDWTSFAASRGATTTFYGTASQPHLEQSVRVSVLITSNGCAALAPVFQASNECGLWVAPQWRHQKLGFKVLQHALSTRMQHPCWATISHDNPDGPWMAKILLQCGFAKYLCSEKVALWRRDADALTVSSPVAL